MKSLIITGPESTGKTSLAVELSKALSIRLIDEYARVYLDHTQGKYGFEDLEKMARKSDEIIGQHQDENLILDTDILTYKIWSEVKFNKCSDWIEGNINSIEKNLYLLCYPDMDWQHDDLRENPNDRHFLFAKYEALLIKLNLEYFIITGDKKVRLKKAMDLATNYF